MANGKQMGLKLVGVLAAGWLCSAPVAAQDPTAAVLERLRRFELFNGCRPMEFMVADLRDDAKDIGLTRDRLRFTAESRLRAARL